VVSSVTEANAAAPRPGVVATFVGAPAAAKAVLLGVFVNKLAAFIQIFLVLFMTDRGYTAEQAGVALGVYGGGAVLGVLLGGTLADRLGARNATILSMVGSAVLIAALLFVPNYPTLLVAVAIVSLVGQFYRPASMSLLTEVTPRAQLVMITAMYRLSLNLGTTAAPLIGGALIAVSYELLFWAEAAAAMAYAILAAVAIPRRRVVAKVTAAPKEGYRAMFADHRYLAFLAAMFINGMVYCQYLVTLPLDLNSQGFSPWVFGFMVALNGFIVVALELPMTKITQRWPIRRAAMCTFGLVGIGYSIYALPPLLAIFIAGTIIWTLAEILGSPTLFAYPGLVAKENVRGHYIASLQGAFGLSYAVGPVVGALLWSQFGRSVWLWFGALQLITIAFGAYGVRNLPARLRGRHRAARPTGHRARTSQGQAGQRKALIHHQEAFNS